MTPTWNAVRFVVIVASLMFCEERLPAQNDPKPSETTPAEPMPEVPEEDPTLPKLSELAIPTSAQLLQEPPVDWLVLKNGRVIFCEPIRLRPNTLEKMKQQIEDSRKWPRPPMSDREAFLEQARKRDALSMLRLSIPGDDSDEPDYQIHMKYVAQILHHEDLILRRVDLLLNEGLVRDAFELLFVLERDHADWPGSGERRNRLLMVEGTAALKAGELEAAWNSLEQLHSREPKFVGLSAAMGQVVDGLATESAAEEDFPRVRHYLARLLRLEPDHATGVEWRRQLMQRSQRLMDEGRNAAAAGQHDLAATAVERAAHVLPDTPNLPDLHRRLAGRFPRLRVGVMRLAGERSAFPFPAAAEWRRQRLEGASLFELESFDESARYRSALLEQWDPTDLGRRIAFHLKPSRSPSDPLPVLTSNTVVKAILSRTDASHPDYDERLAADLRSVQARPPFEFDIHFQRVPARFEALLNFAIHESSSGPRQSLDGGVVSRSAGGETALSARFFERERSEEEVVLRRQRAEPDGLAKYHIAEVVEHRYPSSRKALQGLLRGEVSMLPEVDLWNVRALQKDARFFVVKSSLPASSVVQFSPRNKVLRSRELRRAMAYSVDRPRLLSQIVLRGAPAEMGRLASAPFPIRSRGYNGVVPQHPYDLQVARALALAAARQAGGKIPELRLVCEPGETTEELGRALAAEWTAAGIPVRVVTAVPAEGETVAWDLALRTIRMAEPAVELWPFLAAEDRARLSSLGHLPHWLTQELLELDQAGDLQTATAVVKRLHEHLQAEVEFIPLWEVDEYLVVRKNMRGVPLAPVHPYQNVESWICEPWYQADTL